MDVAVQRTDNGDVVGRVSGRTIGQLVSDVADLPLPGGGRTADRYERLTALGSADLVVARLAEAHSDALAILAELDPASSVEVGDGLWGVWAADPPASPVRATRTPGGWVLSGTKPWCSGAGLCGRALVTAHAEDGYRLFAVDTSSDAVVGGEPVWVGAGMAGSDTRAVEFEEATAVAVGQPGAYLERDGFWWGAAGVAAVWLGGARRVAARLLDVAARHQGDLLAASVGRVETAQHAAWCTLLQVAAMADVASCGVPDRTAVAPVGPVDREPSRAASPQRAAMRARAAVEHAVEVTLTETGRATGPAPLATDAAHSGFVADLEVYVRQSHGDRDLAVLGRLSLAEREGAAGVGA